MILRAMAMKLTALLMLAASATLCTALDQPVFVSSDTRRKLFETSITVDEAEHVSDPRPSSPAFLSPAGRGRGAGGVRAPGG